MPVSFFFFPSLSSRAYLSWFNFKGGDQQKKVNLLSGGERNRLNLARTLKQARSGARRSNRRGGVERGGPGRSEAGTRWPSHSSCFPRCLRCRRCLAPLALAGYALDLNSTPDSSNFFSPKCLVRCFSLLPPPSPAHTPSRCPSLYRGETCCSLTSRPTTSTLTRSELWKRQSTVTRVAP